VTAPAVTVARERTVTGNTYDKYGSTNPVVRRLMARFERALGELWTQADPRSLLDVGCGDGVLTQRWARALGDRRVVGIDLDDPALQAEWQRRREPNLEYRVMRGERLPFADGEFDMATAIEVLEHVPDAEHTLAEMARVAERWLLVSVPREPLWRVLNVARGAYLRDLGNTPGHVNHWTRRGFLRLLERHGEVVQPRSPLPWTMALVRVPARRRVRRPGHVGAAFDPLSASSTGRRWPGAERHSPPSTRTPARRGRPAAPPGARAERPRGRRPPPRGSA
jgi:SAM-dependent methyltransferase